MSDHELLLGGGGVWATAAELCGKPQVTKVAQKATEIEKFVCHDASVIVLTKEGRCGEFKIRLGYALQFRSASAE